MMDEADGKLQKSSSEIKRDCLGFSRVAFERVLQAVSYHSTMVRQFLLDTPTRTQATALRVWKDTQNFGNDPVNEATRMADEPWPPLFPDVDSPQPSDLQIPRKTSIDASPASNSRQVDNLDQAVTDPVPAVDGWGARGRVQQEADLSSSSFQLEKAIPSSPSDASSPNDTSSSNNTPLSINTPSCEVTPSSVASTPANTPPSACRLSFDPALLCRAALPASLERQDMAPDPIANTATSDRGGSDSMPAARQQYIRLPVEDVPESSEPHQIGNDAAYENCPGRRRHLAIDGMHNTVATTNDGCNNTLCKTRNASMDGQPIPDFDEGDGVLTRQYMSDRESTPLSTFSVKN